MRSHLPLLVIFEHGSPNLDTVETIKELRNEAPGLKFLVLLNNETQFWTVLASRAEGYVVWPTTYLPAAVSTIANGGAWLGPLLTEYLLNGDGWNVLRSASASLSALPAILNVLSPREKEVLNLLVNGLTNQEIADSIQLSNGTIKVHVKNILNKLNVNSRAQAVALLTKIRTGNNQ
ncbi:MAG: response regulator transcription factor [Cyanobacteria bacterium SZAS TMP-1]|nr:response regulator transcription factor [Cyanobacteria bacterium SZAS TMP-1]